VVRDGAAGRSGICVRGHGSGISSGGETAAVCIAVLGNARVARSVICVAGLIIGDVCPGVDDAGNIVRDRHVCGPVQDVGRDVGARVQIAHRCRSQNGTRRVCSPVVLFHAEKIAAVVVRGFNFVFSMPVFENRDLRGQGTVCGVGGVHGSLEVGGEDCALIETCGCLLSAGVESVDRIVCGAVVRQLRRGDGCNPVGATRSARKIPSGGICPVVHEAGQAVDTTVRADNPVASGCRVIVLVIAACRKGDALDAARIIARITGGGFVSNQILLSVREIDLRRQASGARIFRDAGAGEIGFDIEGGEQDRGRGGAGVVSAGVLPLVLDIRSVLENLQGNVPRSVGPIRLR